MSEVFTTSGESDNITAGPTPQLQGLFLPGIDNSQFVDGFGIVTPWGGGSTARKYGDYGIRSDISIQATQLSDLADSLVPAEGGGISFGAEGPPGIQGIPGPQGLPGIITVLGLNSNFLTELPHNLDLINDLGTAINKLIYTSAYNTYTGITWTESRPAGDTNKNWRGVASDDDGSNLIASDYGGRLWTSDDSGVTWTERRPAGDFDKDWLCVASDSDGSHLIAGIYMGRLYTSADSGVSWVERQPAGVSNESWRGVASDSDGSHLIAGTFGDEYYLSDDYGVNWTTKWSSFWQSMASDSDGSNLILGSATRLYTSANSGADWVERQPAGDVNRDWESIASDSDGSHLLAGVKSGRLYTSANSGVGWTERQPDGNNDKNWFSGASDSDGSALIVGESSGRLYVSTDSGATWMEERPAGDSSKNWVSVAIDSDGSNLMAASYAGRLYIGAFTVEYSEATWAESDLTSAGRALLDDANAAAQATTLGLGTGDSPTWAGGEFTGAVSGITPTADAHFTTREYVDGLEENPVWEGGSSDVTLDTLHLSVPQPLHTGDSPIFADLKLTGRIFSGTLTITNGTYDDLDVSGVNTIFTDTSGGAVIIRGTLGGVDGQILCIAVDDATGDTILHHEAEELGGSEQEFILHVETDETLDNEHGGWIFVNHGGVHWHDCSHAKHV